MCDVASGCGIWTIQGCGIILIYKLWTLNNREHIFSRCPLSSATLPTAARADHLMFFLFFSFLCGSFYISLPYIRGMRMANTRRHHACDRKITLLQPKNSAKPISVNRENLVNEILPLKIIIVIVFCAHNLEAQSCPQTHTAWAGHGINKQIENIIAYNLITESAQVVSSTYNCLFLVGCSFIINFATKCLSLRPDYVRSIWF